MLHSWKLLANLHLHIACLLQLFCVIQIKDCNVVASKLILILDDLLWVLTDSQLKAMVQYAKSLSEAMEKSAQQRKSMATEDQVPVSDFFPCIENAYHIFLRFFPSFCHPPHFSIFPISSSSSCSCFNCV